MKKITFIIIGFFFYCGIQAQTAQKTAILPTSYQVIAPVVGDFENEEMSMSFTMGETAVGGESTNGEGSLGLSQGFQHPSIILIGTALEEVYLKDISIYPNPSAEQVFLDFPEESFSTLQYVITDLNGKTVKTASVNASEMIDISSLVTGVYVLTLQTEQGEEVGYFKLQKIE